MRRWLNQRPWIWILVLFLFFIVANIALVLIAFKDAPPRLG